MIKFSLADIASRLGFNQPTQDVVFEGLSKDSRTIKPNELYIAIQGEQFDGHEFIQAARANGAAGALVSRTVDLDIPKLFVQDTLTAFGKIGGFWRDQFQLPIIALTGSNGKTTTKNMIACILRAASDDANKVLATDGNLNNQVGLPLMLSKLNQHHRYAVFELGMNQFGEIAYLTRLVKPAVALITNAAESHLEGVGDVSGVAKAKGEIFEGLASNGVAVLNQDDDHFAYWKNLIGDRHSILTFGLTNPADITATMHGQRMTLKIPQGEIDIVLPLIGRHNIMNALAAVAATVALDIPLDAIKKGLETVVSAPGRMRQYILPNAVRLIDDTYNANPFSTLAAIQTLKTLGGTKILVLADMKELGSNAKELHSLTGQRIREAGIDHLFTYGNLSQATAEAYGKNAQHFTDKDQLLQALKPYLSNGANVLIKGSRSMKMETIVEQLVPHDQLEHHH